MSALGPFNARYLDSEMMGKSRAIAAIEPIQADAVPVAALKAALIVNARTPVSCSLYLLGFRSAHIANSR